MSRQTGLQDPSVLNELQELGFMPETVSLLPLVPVLELAWAEGGITPAERDLLVKLARSRGIAEGSPADKQLTQWMSSSPGGAVFARAGRLIAAVLESGSREFHRGLTPEQLVAYCEQIAAASGGIFGLRVGSVSAEE